MIDVLKDFYKGDASLYDLESALERWNSEVETFEEEDVYVGDQYYQDALQIRDAIQEAIDNYDDYYDDDGCFKGGE